MHGDSSAEKGRFASLPAVYQFSGTRLCALCGSIAESDLTCVDAPSFPDLTRPTRRGFGTAVKDPAAYFSPRSARTLGLVSSKASKSWRVEQSLVIVWPSALVWLPS